MRISDLRAAFGGLALCVAGPAGAYTLDFAASDVCDGAPCVNFAAISQSYGDVAGQLDVIYDGDASTLVLDDFSYWTNDYSGHDDVGFAPIGATGRIVLKPTLGFEVTLDSFFIGSYQSINRNTQITVLDLGGGTFLSTGATVIGASGETYAGAWTSASGIAIEFGPDAYNVGIDDIVFSVSPLAGAAVPLPATALLLAGGLTALAGASRRRRRG